MSNSFLSPTVIAKELLRVLHNNITFCKGVNRQYDNTFANSATTISGKAGPSIRVRKPNRYTVTTGPALVVQDLTEEYVTVSMQTQKHVGMKFTAADLTQTIDDFSERYIKPAGLALASELDRDGCSQYNTIYNNVGTCTVTPATALVYLEGAAKLDDYTAPRDDMRSAVINPSAQAATVNALTNIFNPQNAIARQYEAGVMGDALGFKFKMDQNIASHTCGTRVATGAVAVSGGSQSGASLYCSTTGATVTFTKGDAFTIDGVFQVNPETKVNTGKLQQFVVTANVAASGSYVTLAISPSIIISGATQTVYTATGNYPAHAAAIIFQGAASTSYPVNLLYHRDAFALVSADLIMPDGVDFKAREVFDGISVRIVRQYNINGDELPCRADILYGWATLYPQFCARLHG